MPQHSLVFSRPHLIVLALAALLTLGALSSAPAAHAKSCAQIDVAGGYITSLTVTRVSCATGKTVALAYRTCRLKNGRAGRCTSKVRGYSCKESGRTRIPTEINAKVTCKLGSRTIVHTFQQELR